MRLPGFRMADFGPGQTDEWYTPPRIIDTLGPFDLDPCAPVVPPWPTAARTYNVDDDGLGQPWDGRVWLNPPYSEVDRWMTRMAFHGHGTALVFARTDTDWWWRTVWEKATSVGFIRGRLRFYRPDGTQAPAAAGAPSALVAYGHADHLRLCLAADRLGIHVVRPR